MVKERMYTEIQSYKQKGYSLRRCSRAMKIDRKTVQKYWEMPPEAYVAYTAKSKQRNRIMDAYQMEVITTLEEHPSITSAIIDDQLRERHGDFKPSYRSVRRYVAELREELGIPSEIQIRQYTEVRPMAAGYQAQVDMGQKVMTDPFGKKVKVYIFTMVLSLSRKKFIHFQEKPYTAGSFVEAHDLAFKYYGGRTEEIVYDQDRVMAVSENAGDLILTEVFENYRKYVGFSIHLCHGYDPESKGKIESVVKYVKGNFLSCRTYHGISALNSEGLAWLDRTANAKMHESTKMIPDVVFSEEARHLKPAPTLSKPIEPKTALIRKTNVVHYRQNRYEVPKGSYKPGRAVRIVLDEPGVRISFYDLHTGELLAEHGVKQGIGQLVPIPKNADRFKGGDHSLIKGKVLNALGDFCDMQAYMELLIEKYPRYAKDQLRILYKCIVDYNRLELSKALDYCIDRDLISANDFRDTLVFFRTDEPKVVPVKAVLPVKYQSVRPKVRNLSLYVEPTGKGGETP